MFRLLLIFGVIVCLPVCIASAQEATDPAQPTTGPPADPFQPKPDVNVNDAEDEAKKYPELAAAQKLYVLRDVKGALELLKTASEKHKELPPPKVMLAAIHFRANNVAGGRAALDEAIRDDPKSPEAYLMLVELAIREGRFTEASMLVDQAVKNTAAFQGTADKTKALQGRCYAALVPIAQRWEQWDRARADLDKWLALDPENAVALYRLGEVLFQQAQAQSGSKQKEQLKQSYEKLEQASKLSKALPHPATTMARLFLAAEDKAQAIKWMNYAASQADEDSQLRLGIARWHWGQNNVADARKQADEVLEIDPHSVDAKFLRGVIAFYEQDFDTAKRQFESLLLQNKNHLGGNLHLALALLEQNTEASRQASVEMADRLLRAASNNANVVATVAWIYYRTGKHEQAEQLLKALDSSNMSLQAAYYIAKIQADRGKNDEAKKVLEVITKNEQPFIYSKAAGNLLDRLQQ